MRKKILPLLTLLFGLAAITSGYLWYRDDRSEILDSKIPIEEKILIEEIKNEDQKIPNYKSEPSDKTKETQVEKEMVQTKPTLPTKTITEEKIEVHVTLDIDGNKFLIPYIEQMTAEDVMKKAHTQYPQSFWYEGITYGGDLGTFIKSINGKSENYKEKMHWILYINGKKSNKGISALKLNPGDIIRWHYEKEIL